MINSNGITMWTGVVVDINDPELANRVKVRIFGMNDSPLTELPNKDLAWCLVTMPVTSSSMTGLGTNHNLKNGSTVLLTFLDGAENMQIPIVVGSLSGLQEVSLPKQFSDPESNYPLKDRLGEPDTHRLARNYKVDETTVGHIKKSVLKSVPRGIAGSPWTEPTSQYNSIYPFNKVTETVAGHLFEVDDTPGSERLNWVHKSGSSEEVFPDGTVVNRIMTDSIEIIYKDNKVFIHGDSDVTIHGNSSVTIQGNTNLSVYGNVSEEVSGNVTRKIHGNYTDIVKGNYTVNAGGSYSVNVGGSSKISTHGSLDVETSGSSKYASGGACDLIGSTVDINSSGPGSPSSVTSAGTMVSYSAPTNDNVPSNVENY